MLPVDREQLGDALPGYEIGEELGRGSTGIVLEGTHRKLGRSVAIKALPPALAADPEVKRRFLEEGRLLASFNHVHIVPIYDFVERDELCLLVMERLSGGSLSAFTQQDECEPEAACALILSVCSALDYAHKRGVLHRDVKPDNALFAADGTLRVTDFGIAKVLSGASTLVTRTGFVLGTPAYMAPEQALGQDVRETTDIYATAIVLYRMLAGKFPFSAEGSPIEVLYRHLHEDPTPLLEANPDAPAALQEPVMRALARDPAERFTGAEDFAVAVAGAANEMWGPGWLGRTGHALGASGALAEAVHSTGAGPPVPPVPPTLSTPAETPPERDAPEPSAGDGGPRRGRLVIAAAVAAAAVLAAVLALAGGGSDDHSKEAKASAPPLEAAAWHRRASAPIARQQLASAVLNGRIWVLGGLRTTEQGQLGGRRVENYDPAINTWQRGPLLPVALHHLAATTYRDHIVVAGGWRPSGSDLTASESNRVFELDGGRWKELPHLNDARAAAAAVAVGDRIVVVGGQARGKLVTSTEVFDGRSWKRGADLPTAREHVAAATDGRYVYVVGGRSLSSDRNSSALERYDPQDDSWKRLAPMPTPRGGLGVTVVDENLVAVGGEAPTKALGTVEAYNIASNRWSKLPSMLTPRHGLAVAAAGRTIYAIDGAREPGHANSSALTEALEVHPRARRAGVGGAANGGWREVRKAPTARQQVAASVLDGSVWVIGGLRTAAGGPAATARSERYDPAINTWQRAKDLPYPLHHAAGVTCDGRTIVMGGWRPRGSDLTAVTSDRVLALEDGAWKELPSLRHARAAAAAACVDGRIVVVGGQDDGRLVPQTEVFDGKSWTEGAAIPTAREHLAAATDGRYLYVAGGRALPSDDPLATVERYDPAANEWKRLAPMPTPRSGLGLASIGRRIVAVGGESGSKVLDSVESYDRETGRWTRLPSLRRARHGMALVATGGSLYALAGARRPGHENSTDSGEALAVPSG